MVSFILSLFFSHFELLIGYAICVIFPMPWLSAIVLDVWRSIGSTVTGTVSGAVAKAEPAALSAVETEVESVFLKPVTTVPATGVPATGVATVSVTPANPPAKS